MTPAMPCWWRRRALQLAVRSGDLVMRLGGDEFASLLGSVEGLQSVARVCRRISDSFANPIHVSGSAIHASTSIGVAIYPEDGETVELLYKPPIWRSTKPSGPAGTPGASRDDTGRHQRRGGLSRAGTML